MSETNPVRRIVTIEDEHGKSVACGDGPSPEVKTDPARPGFASRRLWVTDQTPARIMGITETLDTPHTIEPPANGSVCRMVTFPPDADYINRVGEAEIRTFFEAMGSPNASSYSADAPHPYMQATETLDFCIVMEGEITLVLDNGEVDLKEGDTVVHRSGNHAWSNRSNKPSVIFFSLHDGSYDL
ncbi:MAG: cupin [Rhodospirillaceae bacterium]|jgi:mannose-6-phosphate isomerase-like protein (cupin superfamily)|nr:cupin [Rhodospirillaceae bacterium]